MLRVELLKPGKTALRELKTPEPSSGELLVKVKAALTCGTDLKAFLRGHALIPMPGPFGHEFSGTVAAVGRGVKTFKEGDRVMAVHSAPCLRCCYCKKRLYNLCENIMTTKILGAFSEYVLLPPHIVKQNVFLKPDRLGFEEAALLEPLSCVVHSVSSLDIKKGDSALVIGAGPIGLMHLLLLKGEGLKVAVSDMNEERLANAKKLGADEARAQVAAGGRAPYDSVFECTGRPEVWESSVNYVRRGGSVILFGGCPGGTKVTYDAHRLHYDEITLRGVFHFTPDDVKKAFKLLSDGDLPFGSLITGRFPLKDTAKAFELLSEGKGIKYAVIP